MVKILIIDDNETFRTVLRDSLIRAGYDVLEAADGNSGIELCRKERPDLVITDIIMPDKDGAEVIIELQRDFPDIKIFAMSGGGLGDPKAYLESTHSISNLDFTFEKPFAMKEMIDAIKKVVGS